MNTPRTHLDLFSGIGGFAIAAQRCGYTTIGFCEKELYAQQILKERFGAVLADAETAGLERRSEQRSQLEPKCRLGKGGASAPRLHPDIFTLNGADYAGVDLLTGGFPCQPFSVAGQRRGAADDRAIWPEMLRVIDEAKPRWLIGENVAGIITMELDNILSDLESLGYSAWPIVVPAASVDARHLRQRVWIIGRRDVGDTEHNGHTATKISGSNPSGSDCDQTGKEQAVELERSGEQYEDVADTCFKGFQRAAGRGCSRAERKSEGHVAECGRFWLSQSSVRRVADGLPEGLDGGGTFCQWTEEDPGTPRVSTGVKHRAHRLRGLGNAIVPQVAEEIIRSIVLSERQLRV